MEAEGDPSPSTARCRRSEAARDVGAVEDERGEEEREARDSEKREGEEEAVEGGWYPRTLFRPRKVWRI